MTRLLLAAFTAGLIAALAARWAYRRYCLDGDVAAFDHLLGAQWKDVRP